MAGTSQEEGGVMITSLFGAREVYQRGVGRLGGGRVNLQERGEEGGILNIADAKGRWAEALRS